MPRGRLLVVTYAFPPSRSVAAIRWGAMSKYLGRLGFEISVITSRLAGGQPQPEVPRVVRPADLESSQLLRRLLRRSEPVSATGAVSDASAALTKLVVPDGWLLSWAPFALRAARREVRGTGIDCVVTTSPGESTHLVGLAVRRLGPAWVADFRDGWIFEPVRPPSPRPLRAIDRRLEAAVVTRADRVVATTEEMATDFRRRLGAEAVCIPNGWDPESVEMGVRPAIPGDTALLVHTGQLGAGAQRRQPEAFFTALERFHDQEPDLASRIEVIVAGPKTAREAELLAPLIRRGAVRDVGQVSHEEALELQRSAAALLLCAHGSGAPLKLFEYLAAGRPILHVGGVGAAARILRETSSGITVAADQIDQIVDRLREIASRRFCTGLEPRGIEHYSYEHLATQVAAVIDEAIARRR